ncbi:unnamed protein product [Effrenium voratum]|nr:unnamed protein product [Effrenium voratum]
MPQSNLGRHTSAASRLGAFSLGFRAREFFTIRKARPLFARSVMQRFLSMKLWLLLSPCAAFKLAGPAGPEANFTLTEDEPATRSWTQDPQVQFQGRNQTANTSDIEVDALAEPNASSLALVLRPRPGLKRSGATTNPQPYWTIEEQAKQKKDLKTATAKASGIAVVASSLLPIGLAVANGEPVTMEMLEKTGKSLVTGLAPLLVGAVFMSNPMMAVLGPFVVSTVFSLLWPEPSLEEKLADLKEEILKEVRDMIDSSLSQQSLNHRAAPDYWFDVGRAGPRARLAFSLSLESEAGSLRRGEPGRDAEAIEAGVQAVPAHDRQD